MLAKLDCTQDDYNFDLIRKGNGDYKIKIKCIFLSIEHINFACFQFRKIYV